MAILPNIKLPPTPPFKRPRDLAYASDELPPPLTLATLSIQHIATALTLIAYVLAAAQIGGLDARATQSMVTATLLSMAVATFLQAWGGRLGSGLLLVHVPTSLLVAILGAILAKYGFGSMVIVGLIYGGVGLVISFVFPYLRAILPPAVAGVVLCLAGLSLIAPALAETGSLSADMVHLSGSDALVGIFTLVMIVGLSIWGTKQSKLFSLLTGILAGLVLAAAMGKVHGLSALADAPVFDVPHLPKPVFDVDPGIIGAIAVLSLMTQLCTFGRVVLVHKMNDSNWHRPNMRMVGAGIFANSLGNFITAWLGAYPCTTSSTNIAVNHISHSTSRWVGLTTAVLIGLIAFLPQVSLALTLIPRPIIGAVEVYAAAYLIVSGIQLISARSMDSRAIFMIGLSFVTGVGVMFLPGIAQLVPQSFRFMVENGIVVGGVTAVILNVIFRLGVKQSAQLDLAQDTPAANIGRRVVDFVEDHCASWGARRDVAVRAAQAALEASEAIAAAGQGRRVTGVRGSFDEFNLNIELLHSGAALAIAADQKKLEENVLEADDDTFHAALETALFNVSHVLLTRLADRLGSGSRSKYSYLRLHFNH
ncbi:purine/pyrimidine permease [Candidimonas humi]|uniref:Uracil-xanthine permease family protein n=1 Tax=Candidimonas humi TaxID=683355 RepID=A0ABV8NUV6_9BURK|nr:solute carrier family 23 protein [Candidimonas humi]MBV6304866.1 purine/pyrimidine permease [Candidimonas humi]